VTPTHEVDQEAASFEHLPTQKEVLANMPGSIRKDITSPDPKKQEKGKKRLTAWIQKQSGQAAASTGKAAQRLAAKAASSLLKRTEQIIDQWINSTRAELMKEERSGMRPRGPGRPPSVYTEGPVTMTPTTGQRQVIRRE
jgi:hypothetical protein